MTFWRLDMPSGRLGLAWENTEPLGVYTFLCVLLSCSGVDGDGENACCNTGNPAGSPTLPKLIVF